MTNLGKIRFFLKIEILQKCDGIYICQIKYAREVLNKFRMMKSNSMSNPIVLSFKMSKDKDGVYVDESYYK